MKVYIMTKYMALENEEYVDVKKSKKAAEKTFRSMYPFMKKIDTMDTNSDHYVTDYSNELFVSIHEVELD